MSEQLDELLSINLTLNKELQQSPHRLRVGQRGCSEYVLMTLYIVNGQRQRLIQTQKAALSVGGCGSRLVFDVLMQM